MKKVKMFICMAMALTLLWHGTSEVYAITHSLGCGSNLEKVVCTYFAARASRGQHILYVTSNNSTVTCSIYAEMYRHDIVCANPNCDGVYKTNEVRACMVDHEYCPDETGTCQY